MKKLILTVCILACKLIYGQGYNHQWLLGNFNFLQDPKGRMFIDSNNHNIITEFRKMPFKGTQANICDANGNFLMSSNGVWIANANNDTMMNGSGLNPGGITPNWPYGLPMTANNIIINYPIDSSKFILLHHTATFDGYSYPAYELYYSIIDISLDGGLGAVTAKNSIAIADTLNWGIAACKHANGIDWWIFASKHNSDKWYKLLLTSAGWAAISIQSLLTHYAWYNVTQPSFSLDGKKFAYTVYDSVSAASYLIVGLFDRCSGLISNVQQLQLTPGGSSSSYLQGLAFSPSGKYIYACTSYYIFQIDADNLTVDTVAVYDGFISPGPVCCPSTFWNMYLAANGKIYVTSGSSVQHLHVINYPDSAGTACDVQQHAIDLVSYYHLRAVPNHPNYYLGCDTTQTTCLCLTGVAEHGKHDFKFSVSPNPSNGSFKIIYLLPQNKHGVFEVYDIHGRKVYEQRLPPWSTLQWISLPEVSEGVYSGVITSGSERAVKKLIVIKE
jgi:DNA-binding beta-propeller fold protein YncE